jgi:hypothetical protein
MSEGNTMSGNTESLWLAVDRLTQPTSRRIHRDDEPEATTQTADDLYRQYDADKLVRNDLARYSRMTRKTATVPSLWAQANDALTTGREQQERSANQTYRTPCDLDLMEIMADIRESVDYNIAMRGEKPTGSVPDQIRHLASLVTQKPEHISLWDYKFGQWARTLSTYLQAVQAQPHPRRIRGVACPECQIRTVLIEDSTGQMVNVPPIVIDFHDGMIRAAECTGCGQTLAFRGEEMWQLADRITEQEHTA